MPQSIWDLPATPLHAPMPAGQFFVGAPQSEALARLHFLVHNHRRLGLLLGPRGCGKTSLLEEFARQLRMARHQVLVLNVNGCAVDEFLWKVAAGFGTNPQQTASLRELWRAVEDFLIANRLQHIDTVLLLDDVEEAETEVLTAVNRLAQFDADATSRFSMVLAADDSRRALLGDRLQDLSELRIEISPWSQAEAEQFLLTSLRSSGYSEAFMTTAAIERIIRRAAGLPRHVRHMAQLAIIAAEGQELAQIDEHFIESVHAELA